MPKRHLNDDEFRALLIAYIARHFNQKRNAAQHWGIRENYLSMVLGGTKPPTSAMLAELGYQRVRIYRRVG